MRSESSEMQACYAARAPDYDAVYLKPERVRRVVDRHRRGGMESALCLLRHRKEAAVSAKKTMEAYFDAFNRHDPEAVAALFAKGGKYVDPAVSSGVEGKALEDCLRAHYAAFPDASYELIQTVADINGLAACEWRFKGTNRGPLGKSAGTDRAVEVLGASILRVQDDKIGWL